MITNLSNFFCMSKGSPKKLDNLLKPSGLNNSFDFENLSFAEYIEKMRSIIESTRLDLTAENSELIVDANSPFEWIPTSPAAYNPKTGKIKNGILLIHGLFDTPYSLQSIANYFIKKNFLVRAILLPGHGTVPGDLLHVSYTAWLKATAYGIASFKDQVDNFYISGFSTGATLGLCHAYHDKNIKGLVLFSPAIKIQRQFAIITNINHLMSKTIGGLDWYYQAANSDYAKYQSYSFNSAHQVQLLTKLLTRLQSQQSLTTKLFIAQSSDDEVLSTENCIEYFKSLTSIQNRLYLYNAANLQFDDPRIISINSRYPEKNIINFSHISLISGPDHPHYGEQGDYTDTNPFSLLLRKKPTKKYQATDEVYWGAVNRKNLQTYNLRRLTYNPDFYSLMAKAEEFINNEDIT